MPQSNSNAPSDDARRKWDRIREIFEAARNMTADAGREVYLSDVCRNDAEMRREVDSLLKTLEQDFTSEIETASSGIQRRRQLAEEALRRVDPAAAETDGVGSTLPPGTQVGDFSIVRSLGGGGTSVVYEAVQKSLNRTVALKVLREGTHQRSALQRLKQEAGILAILTHPNIAKVIDWGIDSHPESHARGSAFVAVELVAGAQDILSYAVRAQLDTRERVRLMLQVCEGLQHAHQRGIIHRDIKPGNLLVDASGCIKVIDFGLARFTERSDESTFQPTEIGQFLGTAAYMSPEHCRGRSEEIDTRSDLYSLGVVFYRLLTHQFPYNIRDASIPKAVQVVCKEEPRPPSTWRHSLRGDLDVVLLKLLEKDPRRRYQSAAELASDLRRFLNHRPILARPPSLLYQLTLYVRRRPWKAATVAVGTLFLLSVSAGSVTAWVAAELHEHRIRAEATAYAGLLNTAESSLMRMDAMSAHFALRQLGLAPALWERRHMEMRADSPHRSFSQEWFGQLLRQAIPSPISPAVYFVCGNRLYALDRRAKSHEPPFLIDEGLAMHLAGDTSLKCSLSRDGGTLAWALRDGTVRIYDAKDDPIRPRKRGAMRCTARLPGDRTWMSDMALSPDGRILAAQEDGREHEAAFRLWRVPDLQGLAPGQVWTGMPEAIVNAHTWSVTNLAFSPNGRYIATSSYDLTAKVWRIDDDGQRLSVTQCAVLRGHFDYLNDVAWSPDGSMLATGSVDSTVRIWDFKASEAEFAATPATAIGRCLATLSGHTAPVLAVSWHPAGELVASAAAEGPLRLWRIEPEEMVSELMGSDRVRHGSWPVGRFVAGGVLCGHQNWVKDVEFCADRRTLISASIDGTIKDWDVESIGSPLIIKGRPYQAHTSSLFSLSFDHDSGHLVTGGGDMTARLWDLETATCQRVIACGMHEVTIAIPMPRSQLVITGGRFAPPDSAPSGTPYKGQIEVRSANDATLITRMAFSSGIQSGVLIEQESGFSRAAMGHWDGTVSILEVGSSGELTLRHRLEATRVPINSLVVSADRSILFAAGGDRDSILEQDANTLTVWDLRQLTDTPVQTIAPDRSPIWSLAVDPTGDTLAVGTATGNIFIYDISTPRRPQHVITLKAHARQVRSLVFHPHEPRLASGGFDLCIRIWDSNLWLEAVTLHGHVGVPSALAWSPDGDTLVSASIGIDGQDNAIRLWESVIDHDRDAHRLALLSARRAALQNQDFARAFLHGSPDYQSNKVLLEKMASFQFTNEVEAAARQMIAARGESVAPMTTISE